MVARDPEWPVFRESRRVRASTPRTSPRMIRSGLEAQRIFSSSSNEMAALNVSVWHPTDDVRLEDSSSAVSSISDDAFVVGNGTGKDVQQSGFSAAGSAADQDVLPARISSARKAAIVAEMRGPIDQVIDGEMAAVELAYGERRRGHYRGGIQAASRLPSGS